MRKAHQNDGYIIFSAMIICVALAGIEVYRLRSFQQTIETYRSLEKGDQATIVEKLAKQEDSDNFECTLGTLNIKNGRSVVHLSTGGTYKK